MNDTQFILTDNTTITKSIVGEFKEISNYLTSTQYKKLDIVIFGDTVTSIANGSSMTKGCFYKGKTVSCVKFNNNITSIGNYAFYNCKKLKYVNIKNVTSIGSGAFQSSGLTYINLSNVTSIGVSAFYACTSLSYVKLSNNLTKIGNSTFKNCSSAFFAYIKLPNSLTSIGINAFQACKLVYIKLPNSLTNIGHGAFYDCSNLSYIKIPSNITEIGDEAFVGCSELNIIDLTSISNLITISEKTFCNEKEKKMIVLVKFYLIIIAHQIL